MKKLLALLLTMALTFSLVACSTDEGATVQGDPVTVRLLAASAAEDQVAVIRDQLTKAGFNVEVNLTPNLSARIEAQEAGEYDIVFGGWNNITGNPDYSARPLYHSASEPTTGLSDPKVDELIDLAATQIQEEYIETYSQLEQYMVAEMAYFVPLYSSLKLNAYNHTILDGDYINLPKATSQLWNTYSYLDATQNDTRTLMFGINNGAVMTHLDPIQANDTSVGSVTQNTYIRLVNLDTEDNVITDGGLAYEFAIAEGNKEYYLVIRDDVNFAKVENGAAVDTGVMVSGEDVVFSLDRARVIESVPSNAVDGNYALIESVELVTDIAELNDAMTSGEDMSIYETLAAGTPTEFTTVAADKTQTDNAGGAYQVVKITTKEPFPQILNMLAHMGASIVSEQQVSAYNDLVDSSDNWANYDLTKDVVYGDFNAVKQGDNHLWSSGAYVMVELDDLGATFLPNPGFMTSEAEDQIMIDNVYLKFYNSADPLLADYRSGAIDYLSSFTTSQYETLAADENTTIIQRSSNAASYCTFNLNEESTIFTDVNLRLAILHAIDPQAFIAVNNNLVEPTYSTMSPLIGTPNAHVQNLELSTQYLQAYYDSMA